MMYVYFLLVENYRNYSFFLFFSLLFFEQQYLSVMRLKLPECDFKVLPKGSVSQIFLLRSYFLFYVKNRVTFCHF